MDPLAAKAESKAIIQFEGRIEYWVLYEIDTCAVAREVTGTEKRSGHPIRDRGHGSPLAARARGETKVGGFRGF